MANVRPRVKISTTTKSICWNFLMVTHNYWTSKLIILVMLHASRLLVSQPFQKKTGIPFQLSSNHLQLICTQMLISQFTSLQQLPLFHLHQLQIIHLQLISRHHYMSQLHNPSMLKLQLESMHLKGACLRLHHQLLTYYTVISPSHFMGLLIFLQLES